MQPNRPRPPRTSSIAVFLPLAGLLVGLPLGVPAKAGASPENQGFLYGTLRTVEGSEWSGYLRWGRQEAFWDDLFHSLKTDLPHLEDVDEEALREGQASTEKKFEILGLKIRVSSEGSSMKRMFITRFGDVAWIEANGRGEAELGMRDGGRYEVAGYSDDVEGEIRLHDAQGRERRIAWEDVDRIEFAAAPEDLPAPAGRLFGEVETRQGRWKGFVMWDKEECLSSDLLDGETRDGELSVEMGRIRSIERRGSSSSLVELESGDRIRMRGTNDVDDDNRGIMVEVEGVGRVTIDWEDFEIFHREDPPHSGRGYADYGRTGPLRGRVDTVDGEAWVGRLVLDLDESEGWEMLNGSVGPILYDIPLENVRRLKPLEEGGSWVKLRAGDELVLEEGQDVTERNQGVLIYADPGAAPQYVPWSRVVSIRFDP